MLIEVGGFRFLTDPTFDEPGEYAPAARHAEEDRGAGRHGSNSIGAIDAVLLSHDQHADNLDHGGRDFLPRAGRVLTTIVGAGRLGGNAEGLAPWQTLTLSKPDGSAVRITATPARHGPAGIEPLAGDVIGFILSVEEMPPTLCDRRHGLV